MNTFEKIEALIKQANDNYISANPTGDAYTVTFEESSLMNVKVDDITTPCFAYIEEFTEGSRTKSNAGWIDIQTVQIYFCRFTELHADAITRQNLRFQIENEIVKPFFELFRASGISVNNTSYQRAYPFPRFDANEVSVMIKFDCKMFSC